jgi:hypothetical protein
MRLVDHDEVYVIGSERRERIRTGQPFRRCQDKLRAAIPNLLERRAVLRALSALFS